MGTSMPEAGIVDLAGDNLGTMRGHLPDGVSPPGTAHLYVLQFGHLVKIGKTNDPTRRLGAHRNSSLSDSGGPLVRAWISGAHATARPNEVALRLYSREIGGARWHWKHEVFTGLANRVDDVIARAAALALADPTLSLDRRLAAPPMRLAVVTAQRDTLASALDALLRLEASPTTGTEWDKAVEQAHAALATVAPTTGGAR